MLVPSRRPHESVDYSSYQISVHVESIQSGAAFPGADEPSPLLQLDRLLQKRLEIARLGLTELRRRVQAGDAPDAEIILDKLDEDLHLLQRRVRGEVARAAPGRPDRLPRKPR
jgi:hypothetical protein